VLVSHHPLLRLTTAKPDWAAGEPNQITFDVRRCSPAQLGSQGDCQPVWPLVMRPASSGPHEPCG
jgi:hypothetical protein